MAEPTPTGSRRRWRPTVGLGAGACLVTAGWVVGLRSLADNSFFTHLATGRLILDTGSVPSVDPYTFTAHGEPWVVQSWLASVLYATVESVAGSVGLRLLMGATVALLVAIGWRLLRPAESIVVRLALGVLFVCASAELWAERPLMLGLVALGCVVVAGEGGIDPRWLVPIAWLWVNVHGSFPLGVAYLVVAALGRRMDGRTPSVELRALAWLALGILLGAIGPLGPRVLLFPVELLQRRELLSNVIEWRPPTFDGFSQRLFMLQLVLAIVLLVRRPTYRAGLVVAVFTAAALLGARNVPVASLVLLPLMAEAAPAYGSLRSGQRERIARLLLGVAMTGAVLFGAARLGQPDFRLGRYPSDALAFLEDADIALTAHPMATPDVVGNYLELVYGDEGIVFYDDRFDMFPSAVSEAHLHLVQGGAVRPDVERYEIELITWERSSATGARLVVDPAWRTLYVDDSWLVSCRRGTELGGSIGLC